jgi:hypothetical protein
VRRREGRWRLLVRLGLTVTLGAALVACGGAAGTFSPEGPCLTDGRAAGTYPALEAMVPRSLEGVAADSIDSGRNCSQSALGSLTSHGVTDLRFAGATWSGGSDAGTSIAVLALPNGPLPIAWAEEFYAFGARTAKKTDNLATSRPTFDEVGPTFRVDALNDLSYQSVVVWPDGALVRVVIVATAVNPGASMSAHDARIAAAVAAATATGTGPGGSTAPGASGSTAP